MTNHAVLYDVWNVKLEQYAKGLDCSRVGEHFSEKKIYFLYVKIAKTGFFNPYF